MEKVNSEWEKMKKILGIQSPSRVHIEKVNSEWKRLKSAILEDDNVFEESRWLTDYITNLNNHIFAAIREEEEQERLKTIEELCKGENKMEEESAKVASNTIAKIMLDDWEIEDPNIRAACTYIFESTVLDTKEKKRACYKEAEKLLNIFVASAYTNGIKFSMNESVSGNTIRPDHYKDGRKYEPIAIINIFELNFNIGNVLKYISRYKRKGSPLQDICKAIQYLNFEIDRLA